jgi:hypothetical protein
MVFEKGSAAGSDCTLAEVFVAIDLLAESKQETFQEPEREGCFPQLLCRGEEAHLEEETLNRRFLQYSVQ